VRERSSLDYRFPDPDELLAEIGARWPRCGASWATRRERVQGVGIAAPLAIGGWQQLLGFRRRAGRASWQHWTCLRRGAGRERLAGAC
jgi:hypothetical protein